MSGQSKYFHLINVLVCVQTKKILPFNKQVMKDTIFPFLFTLNFPTTILTQNTENEYNSNRKIMNATSKFLQLQKSHWSNNVQLQCVTLAQTDLICSINKNNSFIYSLTATCSYKMLASWWLPLD